MKFTYSNVIYLQTTVFFSNKRRLKRDAVKKTHKPNSPSANINEKSQKSSTKPKNRVKRQDSNTEETEKIGRDYKIK